MKPKRAAPGTRRIAQTVRDLDAAFGTQGAAALLNVSPRTINRMKRAARARGRLPRVDVRRWTQRIEGVNARRMIFEMRDDYRIRDIAKILEISPARARGLLKRIEKLSEREPQAATEAARTVREYLETEGYEIVDGLRVYNATSKAIPPRHEYRKTFTDIEQAVDWANTITGAAEYCFAVRTPEEFFAVYIDLDRISPKTKRERQRIAREAAQYRWSKSSEQRARRAIREYRKHRGKRA